MNAEVKAKWLAALRSGAYEQGSGRLRMGNQYCCLGVLCDIHAKETGTEWQKLNGRDSCPYMSQEGALPDAVTKWADLPEQDPYVAGNDGDKKPLSDWNDLGATFPQIADLIEKNL